MRTKGVRHPMDQACFKKSGLSKGLNFLEPKREIPLTPKRADLLDTK